jgi:hypothetical protein
VEEAHVAAVDPADAALLDRWRPWVQYDSRESYRADSPAVLADAPGTTLRRQNGDGITKGSLAALSATTYRPGLEVRPGDYLAEAGSQPVLEARHMHSLPGLGDKLVGRVCRDGDITWLQYWFFYYYNPFAVIDNHEGDWELVQIGLDADGMPTLVTCAQHRHCQEWRWDALVHTAPAGDVEVPIVFPALGSHATYFRAGAHWWGAINWPDRHNGGTPAERVRPDVIPIVDTTPWILWPGRWGGSSHSPKAPRCQGAQWDSPTSWSATGHGFHEYVIAPPPPPVPPVPSQPNVAIEADAPLRLQYEVQPGATATVALLVTVDPADGGLPATHLLPLSAVKGELVVADAPPARVVRVAAIGREGGESDPVELTA